MKECTKCDLCITTNNQAKFNIVNKNNKILFLSDRTRYREDKLNSPFNTIEYIEFFKIIETNLNLYKNDYIKGHAIRCKTNNLPDFDRSAKFCLSQNKEFLSIASNIKVIFTLGVDVTNLYLTPYTYSFYDKYNFKNFILIPFHHPIYFVKNNMVNKIDFNAIQKVIANYV